MRAVLQGLDPGESWARYLGSDGSAVDARTARATIDWIRLEFASAARRAQRPGRASLVLLDPAAMAARKAEPALSLEEFAAQAGLSDFSAAEQVAAYAQRFAHPDGAGTRSGLRRERLVRRQLEALRWLESRTADTPISGDPIAAWLPEGLCGAMAAADILTVADLQAWVDDHGRSWTRRLRAVGPTKGARIEAWLASHGLAPQASSSSLVDPGPRRGNGHAHVRTAQPSTGVRPLELLVLPASLRRQFDPVALIVDWVCSKAGGLSSTPTSSEVTTRGTVSPNRSTWLATQALSATQLSCRREAERMLLWCSLVRKLPLAALTTADCVDYLDFLCAPHPARQWCGPRSGQRWSSSWRPFEGPLCAASRLQSLRLLRDLFGFLQARHLLPSNPWASVAVPGTPQGKRRCSLDKVERVLRGDVNRLAALSATAQDTSDVRHWRAELARLLRASTGRSLGEIATLRWQDVQGAIKHPANAAFEVLECYRRRLGRFLAERAGEGELLSSDFVFRRLPQAVTLNPADAASRPTAHGVRPIPAAVSDSALRQDIQRLNRFLAR